VMREGAAPNPWKELKESDWRRYPDAVSDGVLYLDAFMHPNRETTGTLVTNLRSKQGGSAVLRMGFDDTVTVWLNGDEVYRSQGGHQAFLDQTAVAVHLRPGDNRLMVEVGQRAGAWRFLLRVTDPNGGILPVETIPKPWGPTPDAIEGPLPGEITDLWSTLYGATDVEPPDSASLRDLTDYARASHLPGRDQTIVRVSMEGALDIDPSARNLRAWMSLLDESRQHAARAKYGVPKGTSPLDTYAQMDLKLSSAWAHYYARRLSLAWSEVDALIGAHPNYLPAQKLAVTLFEDLGWTQSAVEKIQGLVARYPGRAGLYRALQHGLRASGRLTGEVELLRRRVGTLNADLSEHYRLTHLDLSKGKLDRALESQDVVLRRRPEQWVQTLDGIEALLDAARLDEAKRRLSSLEALAPRDPRVAALGVRVDNASGDREAALRRLKAALVIYPRDEVLRGLNEALVARRQRPNLGPPTEELLGQSCDGSPAKIVYQHARTEVADDGRAERWIRRVIQLCTPLGADRYGAVDIFHAPGSQNLEVIKAKRMRGDRESSPIYSERTLSNEQSRLYFDLRAARLRFERSKPGDLIEVIWRLSDLETDPAMPGEYGEVAFLQEEIPRAVSVIEVAGPAASQVKLGVVTHDLPVEVTPGRIVARDVPAVPSVERMPGTTDAFAYVHLSTIAEWSEIAKRYRRLIADRVSPSPHLIRRARALTEGVKTTREKVERLYHTVVDRVRYVGLEFGIHSFQPSPPDETWVRGYGDCKDKAVLLIALLSAVGVEGRFVLVRTTPEGGIPASPASLAFFDHAMVYLPELDRFVDPTVDQNAPWTLPSPDEGARVMVIGEGGALRTVPRRPATEHQVRINLDVTFDSSGVGRGGVEWTLRGSPALPTRRSLEPIGTRVSRANEGLGRWVEGIKLTRGTVTGLRPAQDPVQARGSVELELRDDERGLSFPLSLGGWPGIDDLGIATSRRQPLLLPHLVTVEQRFRFTFPGAKEIRAPDPVQLDTSFGVFKAVPRVQGEVLEVEIFFQLIDHEIPVSHYEAFRSWIAKVRDARAQVVEVKYAP